MRTTSIDKKNFAYAATFAASALLFLTLFHLGVKPVLYIFALSPPLLLHFSLHYSKQRKLDEIDAALPHALLQISSSPQRATPERLMSAIAKSAYGALSNEFMRAARAIKAGASLNEALDELVERNPTPFLRRVVAFLKEGYSIGADMSAFLREIAEDALAAQAIAREAASAHAIQKYTLLFASLAVPAMLGLLINIARALAPITFDAPLKAMMPLSTQNATPLLNAIEGASQLYFILFVALASYFAAHLEHEPKRAILYIALLLPIGYALHSLFASLPLI